MGIMTKLWIGVGILVLLSPLGLVMPERLGSKTAWGEWAPHEIAGFTGYIPQGLGKLSSLWDAPLPDYAFKGRGEKDPARLSLAYMLSALVGVAVTVGGAFALGRLLSRRR